MVILRPDVEKVFYLVRFLPVFSLRLIQFFLHLILDHRGQVGNILLGNFFQGLVNDFVGFDAPAHHVGQLRRETEVK